MEIFGKLLRARPATVSLAAVCAVALMSGVLPSVAAQDSGETEEIDVLTASREEVRTALNDLDARYSEQSAVVEEARAAAERASLAVDRAEARVALARNDVELAREVVAEYAVEAYITPPASDALRVLSISQADDAAYANSVIKILAEERRKVVDVLVTKQAEADRQQAAADAAAKHAADQASAAEVQLIELDRMRAEQKDLAEGLDERLDNALAEAAALAAVDQQMADELAAQELALRGDGPQSPASFADTSTGGTGAPSAPPQTVAPTGDPTPAPPPGPPTTRAPGAPPTTRPPAPPTTRPPAPPGGLVTWADVVNVGGIWVHKSIAGNVRSLLNAATAAGLSLRGGGYRDPESQIATRRANCGPTYYDIYEKPSSACRPPTARPGRSMHEKGLAIDFTSSGALITSRSSPAFTWLKANASRYGFYNLPSEPWHWSTNGN